jgi:hypothetical protein
VLRYPTVTNKDVNPFPLSVILKQMICTTEAKKLATRLSKKDRHEIAKTLAWTFFHLGTKIPLMSSNLSTVFSNGYMDSYVVMIELLQVPLSESSGVNLVTRKGGSMSELTRSSETAQYEGENADT